MKWYFKNRVSQLRLAEVMGSGHPGNYTVINAIAGVPTYGGRSEGSMCTMADGFSRVTGEVTACSGTEGPGFTNMIMNIAAANGARTPLLVLASNMELAGTTIAKNSFRPATSSQPPQA